MAFERLGNSLWACKDEESSSREIEARLEEKYVWNGIKLGRMRGFSEGRGNHGG